MERFTFTNKWNNAVSIGYSDNDDFILLKYDGLTSGEIITNTWNSFQQIGNNVSNMRLGVRVITLTFLDAATSLTEVYQHRSQLQQVFSPMGLGMLQYQNDYLTAKLEKVQVTAQITQTNRRGLLQEYEVELTAHNPIFMVGEEKEVQLALREKTTITLNNDIPTPIRIWHYSCDNPGFRIDYSNRDAEITAYLEYKTNTTTTDEIIYINSTYDQKNMKYGEYGLEEQYARDITGSLEAGSKFFMLNNGANELTLDCDMYISTTRPYARLFYYDCRTGI